MKHNRKIVFNKLIEYIANGTFKPNQKLYSEHTLARIWGVKRNDVRDAMMALELMGLVQTSQGKGTYLTHFKLGEASNPFALMMMLQRGDPEEIMTIRLLLEVEAARFAAKNRSSSDLEKMYNTLKALEKENTASGCSKEDALFHSLIAQSCGNVLLQNLVHFVFGYISYVSLNNWDVLVQPGNESDKRIIIDQHKAVYHAIYDGLPDVAAERVRSHCDFINQSLNQKIKREFNEYEKQKSLLWG